MATGDVLIRPFGPRDRQAVRAICCDGADRGGPIENFFPDREAAADVLTGYYTDYEPASTFVAESGGAVAGYINGCFDNRRYGLTMFWIIIPCALLKALARGTVFKKEFWTLAAAILYNWRRLLFWRKESFHSHQGHMHIGVAQTFRGQGVGERLAKALLAAAQARGVKEITASVHGANAPARAFFECLGFEPAGRHPMVMVRADSVEKYESIGYVKRIL